MSDSGSQGKFVFLIIIGMLLVTGLTFVTAKIHEPLVEDQFRIDGNIGMEVGGLSVYQQSNTEPYKYKYKIEKDKKKFDLEIEYCSKDDTVITDILKKNKCDKENNGIGNDKKCDTELNKPETSTNNGKCKVFKIKDIKEKDKFKFGDNSTHITIVNGSATFTITPEDKINYFGIFAKPQIEIFNSGNETIGIWASDVDVSFKDSSVNVDGIYYDEEYESPVYETVCNNETIKKEVCEYDKNGKPFNCQEKIVTEEICNDVYIGSETKVRQVKEDRYLTIEPNETLTFTIRADIPMSSFSIFKYDVSFYYGGEWYLIDPNVLAYGETPVLVSIPTGGNFTTENLTVNYHATGQGNFTNSTDGISRWAFNVDSTTQVDSWSGYNGNVVNGAAYTSDGYLNGAYEFDGVDDRIDIDQDFSGTFADEMTYTMWFKIQDGGLRRLFCAKAWVRDDFFCLYDKLSSGNDLVFSMYDSAVGYGGASTGELTTDTWHHYAMSWNGSLVKIFVDGVNVNNGTFTGSLDGSDRAYEISGTDAFEGTLDEIQVYSRALSNDEIIENYQLQKNLHNSIDETKMIIDWRLDDSSIAVFNMPFENLETEHSLTDSDTVGLWYFENNADDETGNYDGIVTGATYTSAGKIGGAYDFDASGDYITTSDIDGISEFTLSSWVYKTGSDSGGDSGVFWKNEEYGMRVSNSGVFQCFTWDGAWDALYSGSIEDNIWYHLTCSFNGSRMSNYINGNLVGGKDMDAITPSSDALIIGRQSSSYEWNGKIDEPQLFDRGLSGSEIKSLYKKGLNDEMETFDYSTNGNDGLVVSAIFNSTGGYDGFGAYEFDADESYIKIKDIDGISEFTLSSWVYKTDNDTGGANTVVWKNDEYGMRVDDSGGLQCFTHDGAWDQSNGGTIEENVWSYVSCSYNGSGMSNYVNGVFTGSKIQDALTPSSNDITIGRQSNGFDFIGSIDEVQIFNRSLSAEQISALYNNRTDLIVSGETEAGDVWEACTTPNDGTDDGLEVCSNELTVLPPSAKPSIDYVSPTPVDDYDTSDDYFQSNYTINTITNLTEVKLNYNDNNYSLYDSSLVLMLNMNNNSAIGDTLTETIDVSLSKQSDFELINGVTPISDGKFNGALDFAGNSQRQIIEGVSSNDITGDYSQTITMSAWIRHSYTGDNGYIASIKRYAGASTLFALDSGNGNPGSLGLLTRNYANSGHNWLSYNGGYNDGEWHHLVGVIDGLSRKIYIDGDLKNSDNKGMQNVSGNTNPFTIGGFSKTYSSLYFDGSIDEFRIYNRSLSKEEVEEMYYSNLNKINNTKYELYVNQSIIEGANTYYACASNADGEACESERTINLDSTPPIITAIQPIEKTYKTNTLDFNISLNEDGSACWYSLNSASNVTMTQFDPTYYNSSESSIPEGTNDVIFYCNDTLGNLGSLDITFGVDSFPPAISLNYPLSTTYLQSGLNLQFNYTPSPNGGTLESCELWGNWNSGWHINLSTTSIVNDVVNTFTQNISNDGTYLWNIWCNESTGNSDFSAQGNQTFIIDINDPIINITYPVNDTEYFEQVVFLNYTFTESNPDTCWYSTDDLVTNITDNCDGSFNVLSHIGYNTWYACINDSSGRTSCDVTNFNINEGYEITVISPTETTYNYSLIDFNISVPEDSSVCIYTLDNFATNNTMINLSETSFYGNKTLVNGDYSVNFWCNNTAGYSYDSEIVNFTVVSPIPPRNILQDWFSLDDDEIVAWMDSTGKLKLDSLNVTANASVECLYINGDYICNWSEVNGTGSNYIDKYDSGNFTGSLFTKNTNSSLSDSNSLFQVVSDTRGTPQLLVQDGGANQASLMVRSWLVVNQNNTLLNSSQNNLCSSWGFTKLDCNTSTTGADFGVTDDIEALGLIYAGEGLRSHSTEHGSYLVLGDRNKLYIGSDGEYNATTNIFCDHTASNLVESNSSRWLVIFDESSDYDESRADINVYINSSCVELKNNPAWNVDFSDTKWNVNSGLSLVAQKGGFFEYYVGNSSRSSFKIKTENGLGDTTFHIDDVAGTNSHRGVILDQNMNGFSSIAQNIFMYSTEELRDQSLTMLLMEAEASHMNGSDGTFIDMRVIGVPIEGGHFDGIKMPSGLTHLIEVGSADTLSSAYYNDINITANVTDVGNDVTVFENDNDVVYVGNSGNFTSLSVALSIGSSTTIAPKYYYCDSDNTWQTLDSVTDSTNGFRISGTISFSNPIDRGNCNQEMDGTPFSDTTNYTYIAIERTRNNILTDPVIDRLDISGGSTNMFLSENMYRPNPVDTAPEVCGASTLGAQYFDIDNDFICVCTSSGWFQVDDGSTSCT